MVFDMRNRGRAVRWGTSMAASALFATVLVFVGGLPRTTGTTVPVTPSAATTYFCSGYSGCRSAGYSDAGYGAVSGRMYWRMYAGHNCTNYVAYRVIKDGGPATRPWSGGGNASEWGLEMRSITDQVPNVGAIAWWGRYDNGSGSAGHVAYVERVVSSSEIIISEDSWGGTFHWRRVTKSSGRWPTGFIHFTDKQLRQSEPATVSGTPTVGSTLTAAPGTWNATASFRYEWLAGGEVIPGATRRSYTPVAADYGKRISVRVTATRSGYTPVTVTTEPTTSVAKGTLVPADRPLISGEPIAGNALTATGGTWNLPDPDLTWRWFVDGVRVPDASTAELTLLPEHVGKRVQTVVVARKDGYRAAKMSAPGKVGPVLAGTIEVTSPTTIAGIAQAGRVLAVRPGTYTPADATVTHQWLRDGVPIPGATHLRYRLGAADVGRIVTVQTEVTRPDYRPLVETVPNTGRVTVRPTITVRTAVRGRYVVVTARVTAPGVDTVDGQVRMRVGRYLKRVDLVDGRASTVRFGPLTRGEKPLGVHYVGNDVVLQRWFAGSVVVR